MSADQLSQKVVQIIISSASDENIQANLVDLLGYDNFEFITNLLSNRSEIVSNINTLHRDLPPKYAPPVQEVLRNGAYQEQIVMKAPPGFGPQVSVNTESEKAHMKQMKKDLKKRSKMTDEEKDMEKSALLLGMDGDYLKKPEKNNLLMPLPIH